MAIPNLFTDEAGKFPVRALDEMSRLYYLSRAIHVVAELGIADQIDDQPIHVDELSKRTRTHAASLHRLLRFLASYGVFHRINDDTYAANDLSAALRDDHPNSIRPNVRRIRDDWWSAVGQLEHTVRTGEPAFVHVHGMSRFEYLKAHPDLQKRYNEGMANISEGDDAAVADAYSFERFGKIVDVGGGRGGLLAQILLRAEQAYGVLFDQPQVVSGVTVFEKMGLSDRCELLGGDFFQSAPTGGDCYVIKGVLHDFDDDQCVTILSNCREAVVPDGRIVIANQDLPSAASEPHLNFYMDLHMMTVLAGRERVKSEWEALFEQAGLDVLDTYSTDVGFTLVEGRPV